ncbi:MAG: HDIG domain-containing metalloprotein, partial [Nanobdellota archaeon]
SKTVQRIALKTAQSIPGINKELIATGALLHDIGRFQAPPKTADSIKHGIYGAQILHKEGLPEHARIAERHIGIGITKQDIEQQLLPLPPKDFVPETKEELVITYADNLDHDGEKDESYVEERFAQELGEEYRQKVKAFHQRVHKLKNPETY